MIYPKSGKLNINSDSLLEPDVVKILIGSESDFKLDPFNPTAFGIAQITKETFKVLRVWQWEAAERIPSVNFYLKNIEILNHTSDEY